MAESLSTARLDGLRVLVVEDNEAQRRGIGLALLDAGAIVEDLSDGRAAIAHLSDSSIPSYHAVVTDLRLPGADGLEVMRAAAASTLPPATIVMTAYGTIDKAVEAMRLGAFDFLQKPFEMSHLVQQIARACSGERASDSRGIPAAAPAPTAAALRQLQPADVVAESQAMCDAIDLARRVANSRSSVLITGETGTGKEIIAGLIHAWSGRPADAFVKVNCAALPESLLESELFGHERGAFTGADRTRIGRFEQANGGTLFLDEIGDMTLATQAKLLRVLQDQEFHRLGGTRVLRTDARIVAATNRDLALAQREGRFREDLYFRLDVIGIHLPPLRERPEDLVLLAERLLVEFALEHDRKITHFSAPALDRILSHPWPGNVRELRNVIERACLTCSGHSITTSDIVLSTVGSARGSTGFQLTLPARGVSMQEVERSLVLAALERSGYVQKDAAALLHVSRRKLNYMIRRMGITHPSWRRNRGESTEDHSPTPGAERRE